MDSIDKDEKELTMLYNFLPIYPEFDEEVGEILGEGNIENGDPNFNIYRKKEFYNNRLEKIESKPTSPGQLMKHQVIISRFLSSNTPYGGILLMHEPGTGKTCSSVAAIERIKKETNDYNGALILMRGSNLINNYINELVFICTCQEQDENRKCVKSPYIPDNYYEDNITDEQRKRRVNAEIKKFYDFDTFGVFSKRISRMRRDTLIKKYSNKIIVIDETHNLRMTDEDEKQYNIIHEFLHLVKNCKIILLTGTPMVDKPEEIASIMNLILPLDKQLPTKETFVKEFLKRSDDNKNISILKKSKVDDLKNYLHGYVSYLKAMKSDVKKTFVGDLKISPKGLDEEVSAMTLYPLKMSEFQSEVYEPLYIQDKESSEKTGVYNNSIQSSLFVFPDGSYGSEGFDKYVETKKIKSRLKDTERSVFSLKMALRDEIIKGTDSNTERLDRLRKYSTIYADCIKKLIDPNDKTNHFIYIKLVKGSGAILFAKLLELFGFKESKGGFNKGLNYSIITNATTSDKENLDILKTFNSPSNMDGRYIKVIIGSKVISEGITFKNIQNIHIFTPSWNFSETDQAIARGYRLFSHLDLERVGIDVNVNIFLYCAIPNDGNYNNSIDYQMYNVSQDKDVSIKSIEKVIKEASFDCALNKNRNSYTSSMDGSRECNYKSCSYKCDGVNNDYIDNIDEKELDDSTYNLYYNGEEINKIISLIVDIFKEFNIVSITTEKLFYISSFKMKESYNTSLSYFMMIEAVIKMATNNTTIEDKLGYNSFFRFDNNMLYITHNLKSNTNFLDSYYVENFPLQRNIDISSFNDKVDEIYYKSMPKLFNSLKNEQDTEKRHQILHKFPLNIQEFLLETAILSEERELGNIGLRNFLLDEFKPFILRMDDVIVSTLTDNMRCLNIEDIKEDVNWEDCSEDNKTKVKEKKEEKKAEFRENPYGYYGLLNKSANKFSIVDMSAEKDKIRLTKTGKIDTRITRKGKQCNPSWKHSELLVLIDKIKLDIPKDFEKKYSKKSDSDLNNEYSNDKYSEIPKAFTEEQFVEMSREDKLRVMYWSTLKKDPICNAIQKWFKDNNLLEEYISEQKTKKK